MSRIDEAGLEQIRVTCGTLIDAMGMHREHAVRFGVDDLSDFDEAQGFFVDAEATIRRILDYHTECAVCDGEIGNAPRAEVMFKGVADATPRIIHQSCFRTADHEIA